MDEIDDLTREKLREWQMRRLEIKDQMQLYPEKTLELSSVLDLMDEEHAVILAASTGARAEAAQQDAPLDRVPAAEFLQRPGAGTFDLQLQVAASSAEDLRKLLEMAVYELQGLIDSKGAVATVEGKRYPGGMSGTLGEYRFELGVSGEDGSGECAQKNVLEMNEQYRQD